jgi:ATP-dependent Clp protease adaptor protein ClpS
MSQVSSFTVKLAGTIMLGFGIGAAITMGMTEDDAIRVMLQIQEKGRVLLPTSTPEEAARIADSITTNARRLNHPLVCREISLIKTAP